MSRGTSAGAAAPCDRLDRFASATLVVLCLAWGLNHVSIKVANEGLQPVFQSGLRALLGALLVYAWCRYRGIELFFRDGTLGAGILAGILFGAEFLLIYLALDYTTVSRGVLFVYTMPFMVAVGAHFFVPGERLTGLRAVGLLCAFVGVFVAFSDELSLPGPEALIGDVMCILAALGWAATIIVIKVTSLRRASAEKVLLYQLSVAAVTQLALAPLFGPFLRDVTPLVVGAFMFQVVVVVGLSYVVWFWLVARYPAAQLSAFTFLTPLFGVILGGMLLSEPVSLRLGASLALVAVGIYLVNRPRRSAMMSP